MNILLTTVSLDSRLGGGTAERTRRLADHLHRQGHSCSVAAIAGGDLADLLNGKGIGVHISGAIKLRYAVPLLRPGKLAHLVRRADAVHILGYWNLLSVATASIAAWLGKPYVLSAAGEFVQLESSRKATLWFHRLFGRRMIRNAAALVAITPLERRQIIERLGLPEDRVIVLPNGVEDPQNESAREADRAILFLGRLAEVKGPDLLLEAFGSVASEHPDVTLVVAGPDFGIKPKLDALVRRFGLEDRVRFVGHLGEEERTKAYRRALFLVVPSRAEAMSLVALEAGIVGTPVLLTDQCGFDDVAAVGGGRVVPATVAGLADGLRQMLAAPEALPDAGERLRAHVRRNYAWPNLVRRLVAALEELRRTGGVGPDTPIIVAGTSDEERPDAAVETEPERQG